MPQQQQDHGGRRNERKPVLMRPGIHARQRRSLRPMPRQFILRGRRDARQTLSEESVLDARLVLLLGLRLPDRRVLVQQHVRMHLHGRALPNAKSGPTPQQLDVRALPRRRPVLVGSKSELYGGLLLHGRHPHPMPRQPLLLRRVVRGDTMPVGLVLTTGCRRLHVHGWIHHEWHPVHTLQSQHVLHWQHPVSMPGQFHVAGRISQSGGVCMQSGVLRLLQSLQILHSRLVLWRRIAHC